MVFLLFKQKTFFSLYSVWNVVSYVAVPEEYRMKGELPPEEREKEQTKPVLSHK